MPIETDEIRTVKTRRNSKNLLNSFLNTHSHSFAEKLSKLSQLNYSSLTKKKQYAVKNYFRFFHRVLHIHINKHKSSGIKADGNKLPILILVTCIVLSAIAIIIIDPTQDISAIMLSVKNAETKLAAIVSSAS